ncbi:unnamed protein product, partial [Chrysoparadoxa australica]
MLFACCLSHFGVMEAGGGPPDAESPVAPRVQVPNPYLRAPARVDPFALLWEECKGVPVESSTAKDLYNNEFKRKRFSFGCSHLDHVFGGGLITQGITEVTGEAGSGKTQLCLQLALQAQLSPHQGGLGGKSCVLSCGEGDFPSKRLSQLAQHYHSKYLV